VIFRPETSEFTLLTIAPFVAIWQRSAYHRFQDTTTFEVNVTACVLENSFISDNESEMIAD